MINVTYFVHGTTTDNESGIATGWNQGELSKLGLEQSKELGELVADKKFDVVFCSDFKRAVDSARLAFGKKYQVVEDERLREADYGELNGELGEKRGDILQYVEKPYPGGESYEDVKTRIVDFLEYLKKEYQGQHVAIVAHHAPQLALDVLLQGKTWEEAISEDWRKTKSWQPGWEYELEE